MKEVIKARIQHFSELPQEELQARFKLEQEKLIRLQNDLTSHIKSHIGAMKNRPNLACHGCINIIGLIRRRESDIAALHQLLPLD